MIAVGMVLLWGLFLVLCVLLLAWATRHRGPALPRDSELPTTAAAGSGPPSQPMPEPPPDARRAIAAQTRVWRDDGCGWVHTVPTAPAPLDEPRRKP